MNQSATYASDLFHLPEDPHHPEGSSTMLGFWIYLMSDCLIFAMLFATYAVLGSSYAGGRGPKELFDLPLVALNTSMLLLSSITYGFAMLAMKKDNFAMFCFEKIKNLIHISILRSHIGRHWKVHPHYTHSLGHIALCTRHSHIIF